MERSRTLSMTAAAIAARKAADDAGTEYAEKLLTQLELAAIAHSDDPYLQYLFCVAVGSAITRTARDLSGMDFSKGDDGLGGRKKK